MKGLAQNISAKSPPDYPMLSFTLQDAEQKAGIPLPRKGTRKKKYAPLKIRFFQKIGFFRSLKIRFFQKIGFFWELKNPIFSKNRIFLGT
jgi:hypothetical protein